MIPVLLLLLVIGCWIYARSSRRATLAGRKVEKPTYSIEPPGRRLARRSREGRL